MTQQRGAWTVAMMAVLALVGCGSAAGTSGSSTSASASSPAAGSGSKLVVWDWKSGDKTSASYVAAAKADFAAKHPGVTVEFVAQPYDQYYTLLGAAIQAGKGPDVILFNGGGQIRDRASALLPIDSYVTEDTKRLAGWDAFKKDGATYAAPVSLQGHPIYYNKTLYAKAGLDPEKPPTTWNELITDCAAIKKASGASCFALGNKEGYAITWFLSAVGAGILTPQEYDDWIAGKRDWNSPNVKKIFQLWKDIDAQGLNNKGANSTALFNDAFSLFDSGKAANIIGLMSDVGHWKDFSQFLGADKVGVMVAPVVTTGATPVLPYDGGIGYGVAKWTKDPALAADLVRSLTSTSALTSFYKDAGAIVSDTTVQTTDSGPAVAKIVGEIATGKPALHVVLSSKTQDLMGRLSQQLLAGSITVDEVVKQLAASSAAG